MSDGRDPAIKLFGMEIPLLEEKMFAGDGEIDGFGVTIKLQFEGEKDTCKETLNINEVMVETEEIPSSFSSSSSNNPTQNDKKTSTETAISIKEPILGHDHKESNTSGEDKALKKPDKVLPCPRCDSSDTKFCYYNNYNVNQPRHFCKNCQRYWTAGGTMRNVPVGAGRRKNKQPAPNFRHTIVSTDALPSVLSDSHGVTSSTAPMTSLKGNSTILKFGPDAPEYMASMVNLGEQKITSDPGTENREELSSCSSSVTAPNPEENCLPWPNWPYPWNPRCIPVQENGIVQSQILAVPVFCAPTFPFPLIPAPFWGWNMPWAGHGNGVSSPSSSTIAGNFSGNGSPILGKHSREDEKSLWIPKTLRIDDPDEAAKSSIFATLGIKLDECGNFNNLQSNTGRGDALKLLRSNPAALSRSQSFQETA